MSHVSFAADRRDARTPAKHRRSSGSLQCIATFGGVYSNYLALEAVLADARRAGAEALYCLGDVGAFGPYPDRAVQILADSEVQTLQGNYDQSVGNALDDCQCGYTDPRDNHFAAISYAYTLRGTSEAHRRWLRELPASFRLRLGRQRLLMAHGSPRRINEFLWQSTTPEPFVRRLLDAYAADLILVTHTGLHWQRRLSDGSERGIVNVGAIGRPANDGDTAVWYALLTVQPGGAVQVQFHRVAYDHLRLAAGMRAEGLPDEFVQTIVTGWWTTCLEIMPAKERAGGRY